MLKLKEGFVMRNILDEWVIVPTGPRDSMGTYIMTVNETGHMLWEMLKEGTTVDAMLEKMMQEYGIGVDEETARKDIHGFLDVMTERDLLIK